MTESTAPGDDQPIEAIWQVSEESEHLPPAAEPNDEVGHFPPSDPAFDRTPEPRTGSGQAYQPAHASGSDRGSTAQSPEPGGAVWEISQESETLPAEEEIGEEVGEHPPSDPSFPQS